MKQFKRSVRDDRTVALLTLGVLTTALVGLLCYELADRKAAKKEAVDILICELPEEAAE